MASRWRRWRAVRGQARRDKAQPGGERLRLYIQLAQFTHGPSCKEEVHTVYRKSPRPACRFARTQLITATDAAKAAVNRRAISRSKHSSVS